MAMILSKWILLPLVLLTGVVLLLSYVWGYPGYSYWLIPLVVALAAIYVLHPEIDRWYVNKYPQRLPKGMLRFIEDHIPFYSLMDSSQKQSFESAASIYLSTANFMPQGFDKVPEDLKVVVAANAHILASFQPGWHDKILQFENVVIYRHPFPSPQHHEHLHTSELFVKDKVLLFCADHFMKAFRFPQQYFNTCMYEWAKVLFIDNIPEFEPDMESLPLISGFENEHIVEYIGLPEPYIQWQAVATTYFFTFPVRFKMHAEEVYNQMSSYFNVDPMKQINAKSKASAG